MKRIPRKTRILGVVAALAAAGLGLPAAATEPEVELHCEYRPTPGAVARARAARAHNENARILRAENASELVASHEEAREGFRLVPKLASPSLRSR